jgi:hypothetical protein
MPCGRLSSSGALLRAPGRGHYHCRNGGNAQRRAKRLGAETHDEFSLTAKKTNRFPPDHSRSGASLGAACSAGRYAISGGELIFPPDATAHLNVRRAHM